MLLLALYAWGLSRRIGAGRRLRRLLTRAAAGLPDGFHRAAAEAYVRLAGFRGEQEGVSVDDVVAALLHSAE